MQSKMDPHVKHGGGGAATAAGGGGGGSIVLSSWVDVTVMVMVDRMCYQASPSRLLRGGGSVFVIVPRAKDDEGTMPQRRTDGWTSSLEIFVCLASEESSSVWRAGVGNLANLSSVKRQDKLKCIFR